jgi:hypothetical protein
MLPPPRIELLVGAVRDPTLGPVVTVGAGGVWVEALADVAHRVLPASIGELEAAIAGLRVGALLKEGRGRPAVDRTPIVEAVCAVASTIEVVPEVVEIEVNPLFVYDDRVVPVDARVVLAADAEPSP